MTLPNAVPKPRRRAKRRKFSSIKRATLAKARAAERRLRASSAPIPKRNPKRRLTEFARTFFSRARVRWIKAMPCFWCLWTTGATVTAPSDNAHTATGGGSYKAGWETIAPLCRRHHRMFDDYVEPFDDPDVREKVKAFAAKLAAEWRKLCGE